MQVMNQPAVAVKICGLTTIDQANAVAALGASAIGVIGVEASPRFVAEQERRALFQSLQQHHPGVERVWVVADLDDDSLSAALQGDGIPSVVQLHGEESAEHCRELRRHHGQTQWWKALRLRDPTQLLQLNDYAGCVDALLLDAWSPDQLGGTGHRLDLDWLQQVDRHCPAGCPWWLAGGISAEWIPDLLAQVQPFGLDASSRLEDSPGVKDLSKVKALIDATLDH